MKKYLIGIVALVVLALIIVGSAMFYRYQEIRRKASLQEKLKNVQSAYQERNTETFEQAADKAKELLSEDERGLKIRLQLTTIFNRFMAGSPDEKKAAVNELKTIAGDLTLSARSRAFALGQMGELVLFVPDATARAIIFNDFPYEGYWQEAKGDATAGQRIIYEKTIELYPTALYHHLVAYWYAQQLMKNSALTPETRSQYLKIAQQNLSRGGTLLNRDLDAEQANRQLFKPVRLVRPLFTAAVNAGVLGILGEFEAKNAEASFNTVLDLGEKYPSDAATQDQLMLVRLWYADFLRQKFGESRKQDIQKLLKPLEILPAAEAQKYSVTLNYLRKELAERAIKNPGRYRYVDYQDLEKLAAFDSQFKQTLKLLGWKF